MVASLRSNLLVRHGGREPSTLALKGTGLVIFEEGTKAERQLPGRAVPSQESGGSGESASHCRNRDGCAEAGTAGQRNVPPDD